MSSSLISSRSISGSSPSSRRGREVLRLHRREVAARALDPHSTSISRPTWSIAVPFADVLPPPKFATARSAPSKCDASSTWLSASLGTWSGQRSSAGAIIRASVVIDPPRPPRRCSLARRRSARRRDAARRSGPQRRRARPASPRTAAARRSCRRRAAARGRPARRPRPARRDRPGVPSRAPPAGHDAQHDRLELRLDVVGLVDGQAWQRVSQLEEDQKQLERVHRTDDQVVVGVLAVVEMKPAQTALGGEDRDDLLDIRPVEVMAESPPARSPARPAFWHASSSRAPSPPDRSHRTPARTACTPEQQLLLGRQRRIDLVQALEYPGATLPQIVLARVVGAVREPQRLRRRAERSGDLHALEQLVGSLRRTPGSGCVTDPSL